MSPLTESRPATPGEERTINWYNGQLRERGSQTQGPPEFPLALEVLGTIREGRIHCLVYEGKDRFESTQALNSIKNYLARYYDTKIQSRILYDERGSVLYIRERPKNP